MVHYLELHLIYKLKTDDQIGLKNAVAIGIGGMVGGGIFAVLGLAVDLAKGGTPVAFLIAGSQLYYLV